ncbi:MAG: Possible acyl protein synthase/acyl-CoA reductase-like protein, partial [uncultured Adhaeribacter sp.]
MFYGRCMDFKQNFKENLYAGLFAGEHNFTDCALALFRYQAQYNPVYGAYLQYLKVRPEQVQSLSEIPFLPIEFFKTQTVQTGIFTPQTIFLSSGTTQSERSRHLLPEPEFYLLNARSIFESCYGPLTDYVFLALLPSYLEQGHSSLVAMVDHFMTASCQPGKGFFLHDLAALCAAVKQAGRQNKKIMLFGVTYALLDLADYVQAHSLADLFGQVLIMETGGMKGRRREMIRSELHEQLKQAFRVPTIHSEYGMTELLSQAYSLGEGIFRCPPTMQILLRDPNDPFSLDL